MLLLHRYLLLLPAGSMRVNDELLRMRDAVAVKAADDSTSLLNIVTGDEGAHFMIIEMAKSDD